MEHSGNRGAVRQCTPRMTTYTDIAYHIVFATKHRVPVLRKERRDDLYRFIWGIIKERSSHLYRIGGVEDHVHILSSLHPTVALADFVRLPALLAQSPKQPITDY